MPSNEPIKPPTSPGLKTNKAWVAGVGSAVTWALVQFTGMPSEAALAIGTAITVFLTWLIPNAA